MLWSEATHFPQQKKAKRTDRAEAQAQGQRRAQEQGQGQGQECLF